MYVVVIAALLFGVITISFIRLIISESLRTTNDELAQSAYNSALAGVEDAKTALMMYYGECRNASGADRTCNAIKTYIGGALDGSLSIPDDEENCSTVSNALRRNGDGVSTDDVHIEQSTGAGSNTDQAYTCVTLADKLDDYSATLSSNLTIRVIPLKYVAEDAPGGITGIKISWYDNDRSALSYGAYSEGATPKYNFQAEYSTPPVISAQIIQTAVGYDKSDFTKTEGGTTDRGTVFLVPTARGNDATQTHISKDTLLKSNDHEKTNYPAQVKCKNDQYDNSYNDTGYACSTTIELPDPVNASTATRNKDTFFLIITLPYANPESNFSIQLCTDNDAVRGDCLSNGNKSIARFDGVQTAVDSTGRANDMFSRVEARIELSDIYFPYAEFALDLTTSALDKNYYISENCWYTSPSENATILNTCDNSGMAK